MSVERASRRRRFSGGPVLDVLQSVACVGLLAWIWMHWIQRTVDEVEATVTERVSVMDTFELVNRRVERYPHVIAERQADERAAIEALVVSLQQRWTATGMPSDILPELRGSGAALVLSLEPVTMTAGPPR